MHEGECMSVEKSVCVEKSLCVWRRVYECGEGFMHGEKYCLYGESIYH